MALSIKTPESNQEWENYYQLRYEVLRKPLGQPEGSERNDGDEIGRHFALYDENKLVAIARLDIVDEITCQVRFVAVDTTEQGKGYGRIIMKHIEKEALNFGFKKMILHARDYAVNFYQSLDYTLVEASYKLFGVLQHYLMIKDLKN